MPTAAKIIGAIALGITGMVAAYLFMLDQNDYRIGYNFVLGVSLVGLFIGWRSLGNNPSHNNIAAISSGMRSLALLVITCATIFSLVFILKYTRPTTIRDLMDIPVIWIEAASKYVVLAMTKEVAAALLIGGCISGLVTYHASRRWT